jgi:hypothetical protein
MTVLVAVAPYSLGSFVLHFKNPGLLESGQIS